MALAHLRSTAFTSSARTSRLAFSRCRCGHSLSSSPKAPRPTLPAVPQRRFCIASAAEGEAAGAEVDIVVERSASYDAAISVSLRDQPATACPEAAGVYAVYSSDGTIQYIGLTRKISGSVASHIQAVPELVDSVKFVTVADATRENLTAVWKEWVEAAVLDNGDIPVGNKPGENKKWQLRAKPPKPEVKLTAGKPITGLTIEDLVDQVVKTNAVVAFVKGTRLAPQCGFSHKVMTMLNELKVDYEVVNVLDDVHNPGLREAIKAYSQWPTIPQLYVKGEFVGGADIAEQMFNSGELQQLLKP
jgi:Grx4 family monothiol glutaredoxin